ELLQLGGRVDDLGTLAVELPAPDPDATKLHVYLPASLLLRRHKCGARMRRRGSAGLAGTATAAAHDRGSVYRASALLPEAPSVLASTRASTAFVASRPAGSTGASAAGSAAASLGWSGCG